MEYDKLIRDKIPEIISEQQKNFMVEVATEEAGNRYLINKLMEEAGEFANNPSLEEMADIFEVIDELMLRYKLSFFEVMRAKELKRQERGGFSMNLILKRVED